MIRVSASPLHRIHFFCSVCVCARARPDHEPLFRQESWFHWLTGVKEPDCGLILQLDTRKCA